MGGLRLNGRAWIAVACALVAAWAADAEPRGRLSFRTFSTRQGLNNQIVTQLVQDREGLLWAATNGGLFRYDGSRFEGFGLQSGLPSSVITSLALGEGSSIWVGTQRGLGELDAFAGRVTPASGLPVERVNALAFAGGRLWVATASGLYRRLSSGQFIPAEGWTWGAATALWLDGGGLFAASSGQVHWMQEGGWSTVFGGETQGLPIDGVLRDRAGILWIRTPLKLWSLKLGAAPVDQSAHIAAANDQGALFLDRRGDVLVPTTEGLARHRNGAWTWLRPADGLPGTVFHCAFEDREGSLWVGGIGLHQLLGHGLWRTFDHVEGLDGDVAWNVFRDRTGKLWVGTDKGLAWAGAERFSILPGTEDLVVRTLVQTADGSLWFGGQPGLVVRRSPSGALQRFGPDAGLHTSRVLRLLADHEGGLWVATVDGGLLHTSAPGPHARFEPVELPGGSPRERIGDLILDAHGHLWAAGELGLLRLANGAWHRFHLADGLRMDRTTYLLQRASGELCVAYLEAVGPSCFREEGDRLREIHHLELSDARVYQLGEDQAQRLWLGTGSGITIFGQRATEQFGEGRGLPSDDTTAQAFLAEPSGDVWVGTSGGLALFRANEYGGPPPPPRPVVLSAKLGEQRFTSAPEETAQPFSALDNVFTARFTALTFLDPLELTQEARLLPLETEWHPIGGHEARYSALSPGAYAFELRARTGGGSWSAVLRLPFVVQARWTQTRLAHAAFALLGAAALFCLMLAIIWLRTRKLALDRARLETAVAQRSAELARLNQELRDQSLTDPLTGLRNRRFFESVVPTDAKQAVRAHRSQAPTPNRDLLLFLVDLDFFKRVNDRFGHADGDRVLVAAARRLQAAVRDTDLVVRWGGEEFLIVARQANRAEAAAMAERIVETLAREPIALSDGTQHAQTGSVGWAPFPWSTAQPEKGSLDQSIALADRALYLAKQQGRNRAIGAQAAGTQQVDDALAAPLLAAEAAGAVKLVQRTSA